MMLVKTTSAAGANGGPALPELRRRLRWVAMIFAALFLLLVGRLWQLQVMRGDSYYERTVSNVIKEDYLPSVRGKVVDRNGVPLADNRPAFNIYATPSLWTPEVQGELSRRLGLGDDELAMIASRLEVGEKHSRTEPILVLEDQGRDRASIVEEARPSLPGVEVRHEPHRFYPQGDLAAHLIGYMNQMSAAESERLTQQGYGPSELVGRAGIERAWENYLRGKKGIERYAVDSNRHRLDDETAKALIDGERVIEPVPGANVVLTLDADLQRIAERAVAHTPAAAVVIVEPSTGKIRAIVSKPSYDPNEMTGHLTRARQHELETDVRQPEIDKAVTAKYPPGSIYKFTTALAALEDGASPDEPVFCTGEYELSGTTFHCHGTHGKVDMLTAIQKSCDIYFWKLAEVAGLDRISAVAREYGLGVRTNLGINDESDGRIPTKAWYEEQKIKYKVGFATNASIGQGDVEVTVLQMAMAYAALANGGTLFVPQVVERVQASDGHTIVGYEPKVARQIKTPPDALDTWKKGMWKVTNEPGGTAFDHGKSELPVMGKTGTAEVKKHHKASDEKDVDGWHPNGSHAWFAGWAPAEDPELAIVVLVEHGGAGGKVAWPIARQILEQYFAKHGHAFTVAPATAPFVPHGPPEKDRTP